MPICTAFLFLVITIVLRMSGRTKFSAIRQKINDVEINAERSFVSKRDFDEWRSEYREDMRDLKQSIASIAGKQ